MNRTIDVFSAGFVIPVVGTFGRKMIPNNFHLIVKVLPTELGYKASASNTIIANYRTLVKWQVEIKEKNLSKIVNLRQDEKSI
jgi:hypothetical protein